MSCVTMKDILMGIEGFRFLVLVFGLFMQCAQYPWNSWQRKTVNYL